MELELGTLVALKNNSQYVGVVLEVEPYASFQRVFVHWLWNDAAFYTNSHVLEVVCK